MQIHQIRNATLHITYAGVKFLIDPWLGPKEYMPGFEGAFNSQVRQPRTPLPLSVQDAAKADAVILTHVHPDHWDEYAAAALAKDIFFFVQSQTDKEIIEALGFSNVHILSEQGSPHQGIMLYKTPTQHGHRETVKPACLSMGMPYDAMGVVFKAETEKTLYLAGDTIWCPEVSQSIEKYRPDIIIINACGARLLNGERLIMDTDDVKALAAFAPKATIVASHMDAVSHLTVTRQDIQALHLPNVLIPQDNDTLSF